MYIAGEQWQEAPAEESSFLRDYMNVGNSVGLFINNKELYGATKDDTFNIQDHKEYLNTLTSEELDVAVQAISLKDMENKVARVREYNNSLQAISQDSLFTSIPLLLGAGLSDVTNLIPLGGSLAKAGTMINTASKLGNVAKGAAVAGTGGAIGALASEAVMADQQLPHDYTTSMMYGMAFGGALGALGGTISNLTQFNKQALAKTLTGKDPAVATKEAADSLKEGSDSIYIHNIATPDAGKPYETPTRNSKFLPDVLTSNVTKVHASASEAIRGIGNMLAGSMASKEHTGGTRAVDFLHMLKGNLRTATFALDKLYHQGVKEGTIKGMPIGRKDRWYNEVGAGLARKAADQEMAVRNDADFLAIDDSIKAWRASYDEARKAAKTKEEKAALKEQHLKLEEQAKKKKLEIWTKHKPKDLTEAEKAMSDYFKSMLKESQQVGIKEMMNIHPERLYYPRHMEAIKVKNTDSKVGTEMVAKALRAHPGNRDLSNKDIAIAADSYWTNLLNTSLDRSNIEYLTGGEMFKEGSPMHGRKIYLDVREMMDLLDTNATEAMGKYHYWMQGQIAARQAMPELRNTSVTELRDKFKEVYVSKVEKDIKKAPVEVRDALEDDKIALNEMFEDMMGTLRLNNQSNSGMMQFSRIMTQANAATMSGMMGIVQSLEVPAALWSTGFNRVLHKQFGKELNNTVKALFSKEATDFQNELMQIGYLSSLADVHGINRVADTASAFNVGKIENALMGLNNQIYKYNGMRIMTSWMETIVASNVVTLVKNFNPAEAGKQADIIKKWGLSAKDIELMQKELKEFGDIDSKGVVRSIGLNKMSPKVRELMSRAVGRGIEAGVIQGDTWHVPTFMKSSGWIGKMAFQFMRYPLAANEILLQRGWTEDQAGLVSTTVGTILLGMGMFYLIEQAEIASGAKSKYDAKYDLNTEEGTFRLLTKAAGYAGTLSAPNMLNDILGAGFGDKLPWSDYRGKEPGEVLLGASFQRLADAKNMSTALLKGEFDSEELWTGAWNAVPAHNAAFINPIVKDLIDNNTFTH